VQAPVEKGDDDMRRSSPEHQLQTVDSRDDENSDDDEVDLVIPREMRDSSFQSRFDCGQSDQGRLFLAQGKMQYIDSHKADRVWILLSLSYMHLLSIAASSR
jgi:hypothetical protein